MYYILQVGSIYLVSFGVHGKICFHLQVSFSLLLVCFDPLSVYSALNIIFANCLLSDVALNIYQSIHQIDMIPLCLNSARQAISILGHFTLLRTGQNYAKINFWP